MRPFRFIFKKGLKSDQNSPISYIERQNKGINMRAVHNLNEAKALVKESILNGSIFELDNVRFVSHSGAHVADVLIESSGLVVLRVYPTESIPGILDTQFLEIGNAHGLTKK